MFEIIFDILKEILKFPSIQRLIRNFGVTSLVWGSMKSASTINIIFCGLIS